jgi:hypothetical protein
MNIYDRAEAIPMPEDGQIPAEIARSRKCGRLSWGGGALKGPANHCEPVQTLAARFLTLAGVSITRGAFSNTRGPP